MRDLKMILLFVAATVAIAACGGPTADNSAGNNANRANLTNGNTTASAPVNAATPTFVSYDSKQLYADNCMICHKDTGKGGPVTIDGKKLKPADLTKASMKKRGDDDIVKDITEGAPDDGMPAFKGKLKAEEIKEIVAYIRTLQG